VPAHLATDAGLLENDALCVRFRVYSLIFDTL
jgi:hypothetical protein